MKSGFSYSLSKVLLLYWSWWIFWACLQVIVLHRLGLSWHLSLVDAAVSNFLLGLACFIALLLYSYYQPGSGNRVYRLIFAVAFTLLFCHSFTWILAYLFPGDTAYLHFLERSMPVRFVFSLLLISFVTVLNWVWNNLKEQNERGKREAEAGQLLKEAELGKLRQQLQPHFLFNSLNSISALAGSKPEEARRMIQQLSDFLRGTLKKDEQQIVTLGEELQHLALYLEIEKVRFGHRLNIDIEVPGDLLAARLPPLLLQPIVENAIKFGLYGTIEEITVKIHGYAAPSQLVMEIQNPFDAETQGTMAGTGFGLDSIRRRLLLLYSRNDLLTTRQAGHMFITQLKIPQAEQSAEYEKSSHH